jgi:hypothetical protein
LQGLYGVFGVLLEAGFELRLKAGYSAGLRARTTWQRSTRTR